jgi:hypothetical protein
MSANSKSSPLSAKPQPVKRLDGKLEIRGGTDEDRCKGREWMETFLKPKAVVEPVVRFLGQQ